jgi:hypothetical protein
MRYIHVFLEDLQQQTGEHVFPGNIEFFGVCFCIFFESM